MQNYVQSQKKKKNYTITCYTKYAANSAILSLGLFGGPRRPLPRPRPRLAPPPRCMGCLMVACLSSTRPWKTESQKTQPVCWVSPAGSGVRALLKSTVTKEASQALQFSWATCANKKCSFHQISGTSSLGTSEENKCFFEREELYDQVLTSRKHQFLLLCATVLSVMCSPH